MISNWIAIGSLSISLVLCAVGVVAIITTKKGIKKAVVFAEEVNKQLTDKEDHETIISRLCKGSDKFENHEQRLTKVEGKLDGLGLLDEYDEEGLSEMVELFKALIRVKKRNDN